MMGCINLTRLLYSQVRFVSLLSIQQASTDHLRLANNHSHGSDNICLAVLENRHRAYRHLLFFPMMIRHYLSKRLL